MEVQPILKLDLINLLNLIKIGIALSPAPVYHRNVLKNFVEFATHSYEYYRTYPYRGTQWYLDE